MSVNGYRGALWSQLKEGYGKLLYTYVTQQKQLSLVEMWQNLIKTVQVLLTSVSTVGFLSIAITDQTTLSWAAGISSVLSLALNLYSREASLGTLVARHRSTTDALWPILQDYLSLLTDCLDDPPVDEVVRRRDDLQCRISAVYQEAPRTGAMAYRMARRALAKGEQSFEKGELESLLPSELRNRVMM